MPFPNFHSCRVRDPAGFQKDTFRNKAITKGVELIMAKPAGGTAMTAQAYRFAKSSFTPDEAHKWLKDHDVSCKSFEPASEKTEETADVFDAPETMPELEPGAEVDDDLKKLLAPPSLQDVAKSMGIEIEIVGSSEKPPAEIVSQSQTLEFSESVPMQALTGYDPIRKTWPILAIETGCGVNRCYPEVLVRSKVAMFEGLKVFDNHLLPGERRHRAPSELMGYLEKPVFDTRVLSCGRRATGIFAEFHITNPVRAQECMDEGYRKRVGFSLSAKGDKRIIPVEGRMREEVTDFKAESVDMVFDQAQGGQFTESVDTKEKEGVLSVQQIEERLNTLEDDNRLLRAERDVVNGLADVYDLPDFAKQRIQESVLAAIRRDKAIPVDQALNAQVLYEREYLKKAARPAEVTGGASGGDIKGLGAKEAGVRTQLAGGLRGAFGLPDVKQPEGGKS